MDIKFRTLNYQLAATQAVVNCFVGQSKSDAIAICWIKENVKRIILCRLIL